MNIPNTPATQNDRLLGAAAHASILLGFASGNLAGIAIAAIIWLTQREKSRWVGFQGLQALVYQALGFVLMLLIGLGWLVLFFLSLIPLASVPDGGASTDAFTFFVWAGGLCGTLLFVGAWLLYGLYGALRAYSGADFRYLVIGDWLAQRMAENQA